ncbi:MAG: N-acetylglucosamine-6-phosphate deacetylase [Lentisphaeria bacterium]|nr:N-acetylglucosamine-6-phosphate deacetylase [Lentisphaeria bacterium]
MPEEQKRFESGDFILRVSSLFTPDERVHNASILCHGGMISAVGGYSALMMFEDTPCLDLSEFHAIPGMIDTHIHGTGGMACMDAPELSDLDTISRVLARHGVTSFQMTLVSAEPEKMLAVIQALNSLMSKPQVGAQATGIHIEGPYLRMERAGAQPQQHIRPVDLREAAELFQAGEGRVRMMTFAPEQENSTALIELMCENGVIPSMGHSEADDASVIRAIEAGAERCTHLYNGSTTLDQRQAGLTTVALVNDLITVEIIADGVHVHPAMIDLACRVKPRGRVVGISDATQGAGLRDGVYHLGDQAVEIRDGGCFLQAGGTLAGSCLTLDLALRNLSCFTSLPATEVVSCYTSNAARSVGLEDRGELRPGKRADIVVVDDDWNVRMTIVEGRIVYDAKGEYGPGPDSLPMGAV